MDKNIFLWDVYNDNKNYHVLNGHKNAVLQVHWIESSSPSLILSCSADKTLAIWDANKGERMRKFVDHTGIVNCCAAAKDVPHIFVSGSDDFTCMIWDTRTKYHQNEIRHEYQVTAVTISNDSNYVYTGGIDNIIRRFDLRTNNEPVDDMKLIGHLDTITGLSISPDGSKILSNGMDSRLYTWDIRPLVENNSRRLEKSYDGVHHGAEKNLLKCSWSPDGERIACGSACRNVHIWDTLTTEILYKLPGHKGSVNEVIFHPNEPIIASCSSDGTIYLGELS
jgi:Prp8 binding protein